MKNVINISLRLLAIKSHRLNQVMMTIGPRIDVLPRGLHIVVTDLLRVIIDANNKDHLSNFTARDLVGSVIFMTFDKKDQAN